MGQDSTVLHHAEEESYFVSMTDLLVGMLFIFIILLMSFALNLRQQEARFDRTTAQLTQADKARREMLESIRQSMEAQGVKVIIDPENGVLRLPEELLFLRGDFSITPRGKSALDHLKASMEAILPCYAKSQFSSSSICQSRSAGRLEAIFIEGHTDDRAISGTMLNGISSNWELSARRAIETLKALAPEGDHATCNTASERLLACLVNDRNQQILGVSGYSQYRPVSTDDTEKARSANRRIDLRFLMETPTNSELNDIRNHLEGAAGPK